MSGNQQTELPRLVGAARVATAAWATLTFAASSLPGSAVPGRFGTLAHFLEYAVLGGLALLGRPSRSRLFDAVIVCVSASSAWGVTDELHQAFVPRRTPDPVDWLTDTAGALAGCAFVAMVGLARRRRADRAGQ